MRGVSLNDAAESLPAEAAKRIQQAFLEHALLVFPNQAGLRLEAQVAFAGRFGDVSVKELNLTNQRTSWRPPNLDGLQTEPPAKAAWEEFAASVGGSARAGFFEEEDLTWRINRFNEGWHADHTFMPVCLKAGLLYSANGGPASGGGETEYADMRAAYDALPDPTKRQVQNLVCYHSNRYSLARKTGFFFDEEQDKAVPERNFFFRNDLAVRRPLVKAHPETGRNALYVSMHSFGIPGMSREASTKFLDELVEFACQPPRTYKHTWQAGDLVIWDQRCVLHRARPYDDAHELRELRGTRVAGDPTTEAGVATPEGLELLRAELRHLRQLPPTGRSPKTR